VGWLSKSWGFANFAVDFVGKRGDASLGFSGRSIILNISEWNRHNSVGGIDITQRVK
jgi:hypothetical protein